MAAFKADMVIHTNFNSYIFIFQEHECCNYMYTLGLKNCSYDAHYSLIKSVVIKLNLIILIPYDK